MTGDDPSEYCSNMYEECDAWAERSEKADCMADSPLYDFMMENCPLACEECELDICREVSCNMGLFCDPADGTCSYCPPSCATWYDGPFDGNRMDACVAACEDPHPDLYSLPMGEGWHELGMGECISDDQWLTLYHTTDLDA
eukprot:6461420-Amphidinium_carterae.1